MEIKCRRDVEVAYLSRLLAEAMEGEEVIEVGMIPDASTTTTVVVVITMIQVELLTFRAP